MLFVLSVALVACGSGSTSEDSTATESSASSETTSTTRPTTTTTRRTTTTLDQESETAQILCDAITELLDDNPDLRVAGAMAFSDGFHVGLIEKGYDPSVIGQKVALECHNGYNNEVIMGYGGFGPLADAVDYTLDRGTCGSRGGYGGVLTMFGVDGNYTVELSLGYVVNDIVEHQATERIEVEAGGNGVAFEFYLPQLPAGGTCDVELVSVRPE